MSRLTDADRLRGLADSSYCRCPFCKCKSRNEHEPDCVIERAAKALETAAEITALRTQLAAVPRARDDFAMMLRRMCWQINKMTGDNSLKVLSGHATNLLKTHGCEGSILRGNAPEPMQLPPLTDAMYHAVRGTEITVSNGGPDSITFSLDDDTLDEIWENINTALRTSALTRAKGGQG